MRTSINYFSAVLPFSLNDMHMVASLNYQKLYDFTRKWNFPLIKKESDDNGYDQNIDFQSEGGLSALGIAWSVQITPDVSVGATMNIWDEKLTGCEWESKLWQWGNGINYNKYFQEEIWQYDKYAFSGINFNLGAMWRNVAGIGLNVGAVLKTPFTADLDHYHSYSRYTQYPNLPSRWDREYYPEPYTASEKMEMPMSVGIGFAYPFSDRLMVSLDIYRTEWDDFKIIDSNGNETSPITGKSTDESDIDPTHQVRIGSEYLLWQTSNYIFPLCFGLFYDPAPADGSPDDFYGFSLGSGLSHKKWFTFDIAYQYRFGKNAGSAMLQEWDFSQDVSEHTVYTSAVVYF